MPNYYSYRTQWSGLGTAFARAWPVRGIIPAFMLGKSPGMLNPYMSISTNPSVRFANELHAWANQLGEAGKKLPMSLNALASILARVDQWESIKRSSGPRDRRAKNSQLAWKIPVRRISSHYFQGWYVRRVAPGTWMVYNPTREAYYIEYGIHTSNRRVRRPIRKLALIATLKFADRHKVGEHVWEAIFGTLRQGGGISYRRGAGVINTAPQSPGVMPHLDKFIPGSGRLPVQGGG